MVVGGLTQWSRAPDKVIRFGDMPVMLWLKPGELKAVCGEVEIEVCQRGNHYAAPVRGVAPLGIPFGYSGSEWEEEPAPEVFREYVLSMLENLERTGQL
jgi:hypothetical protein